MRVGIFFVFLFSSVLSGQPTLSLTGPPTAVVGASPASVPVQLVLADAASTIVGLQWAYTLQAGATFSVSSPSAAAASQGKNVSCNADNTMCLEIGAASTVPFADGVIATGMLTFAAGTPSITLSFPLTGLVATNADGDAVPLSAGPPYAVVLKKPPCKHTMAGPPSGAPMVFANGLFQKVQVDYTTSNGVTVINAINGVVGPWSVMYINGGVMKREDWRCQ